jgi:hypothetical protein
MSGKKSGTAETKPSTASVNDPDNRKGALKSIGGSQSDDWNNILANQAVQTLWLGNSDKETHDRQYGAAVAGLAGIGPRDELEGMLAAQLLASHNAAMECYRRAMIPEQTFEGHRENLTQANKLSRTYALLLDALNRHRGKGQQKMTVEHVHVHEGGQAIVGAVNTGGGGNENSEGQVHAPRAISHEPITPMRSPDAEWEAVPIAGGARKAPVQDAWRRVRKRRSDRQ